MTRSDTQANLRFPPDLKDWLRQRAKANRRSLNAEVTLICDTERQCEQRRQKAEQPTT